jgi:hypothetical protein
MELWQRVKDLEKVVADQASRISVLESQKKEAEQATLSAVQSLVKQHVPEAGKKLCPKCNKVPAYFFHVRSCKG